MVVTGFEIACALEQIDALQLERQVKTYRQLAPASVAESISMLGGIAAVTEPFFGRKLNHVAGAGMGGSIDVKAIAEIERCYAERGLRAEIDLCPHADGRVLAAMQAHGFSVSAFSNSYVMSLTHGSFPETRVRDLEISRVGERGRAEWIETSIAGFSQQIDPRPAGLIQTLAQIAAQRSDTVLFIARASGEPVGSAGISVFDTAVGKAAHLYIASTLPSYRKRGIQRALLEARLVAARKIDCVIATVSARPYNVSARNAERAGFRLAYTKPTFVSRAA